MKTITGTVQALLPGYYKLSDILKMDTANAIDRLSFYSSPLDGNTKIGMATITIKIDDEQTIIANQIEVLKDAKKKLQAETQAKMTAIDEQIQSLLCIEHKHE